MIEARWHVCKKYIERALQLTVEDQHCIIDEARKEHISYIYTH